MADVRPCGALTQLAGERRGYIASAPELRHPIVALSLASLRKRIEIALLPDDVRVVLPLDGVAERERHRRQA